MSTAGPATGSHCRLLQSGPPVGSASSRSCPGPRSLPCINETAAMYSIEPTIKLCLLWFALQFAVLPVRMRMRTQRYLLWPGTTQTRIADKGPPAILLHSSDRPGKRCAAMRYAILRCLNLNFWRRMSMLHQRKRKADNQRLRPASVGGPYQRIPFPLLTTY